MLARPAAPPPPAIETDKNWLPWQRPLVDRKTTNFRLIIHTHSSINPENLAKIGPADFEIILV